MVAVINLTRLRIAMYGRRHEEWGLCLPFETPYIGREPGSDASTRACGGRPIA